MRLTIKHWTSRLVLAVAVAATFASCSKDDAAGESLPDGKYPLTFTASVEGLTATKAATRATGYDAWVGSEEVAIQVGTDTKKYILSDVASGSLTPTDANAPFYWSTRTMQVSAWFPIDFRIQGIQDQTNADTYKALDFLHTSQDVVFKGNTPLRFKHAMAKVSVALKAGGGLTDADLQSAQVKIYGYTAATIDHAKGGIAGTAGATDWITPLPDNGIYTALLIPQTAFPAGEKFISVAIGGNTYYYKPLAGDGDTPAGVESRYTITVMKEGLSVAVSRWQQGSEVEASDNEKPYTITITGDGVENLTFSNVTPLGNNTYTYALDSKELPVLEFNPLADKGVSMDMKGTVIPHLDYSIDNRTFKYTLDIRSDLKINLSTVEFIQTPQVGNYVYPDGKFTSVLLANEAAGIVYKVEGNTAYVVAMKSGGVIKGGFLNQVSNYQPQIQGCKWSVTSQNLRALFTIQTNNGDATWKGGWTRISGTIYHTDDGHAWIWASNVKSDGVHINLTQPNDGADTRSFTTITF